MGEYEPDDSRDVTLNPSNVPIEPERTGFREQDARTKKDEAGKTPPRKDGAGR